MGAYMGIPVTVDSWIAIFWMLVLSVVFMLVLLIAGSVRAHRLGALFPKDILGLKVHGETYDTVALKEGKVPGTLETTNRSPLKKQIYFKPEHTIIKSTKGGPMVAILSSKAGSSANTQMRQYAIMMKNGTNPYGLKFDTLTEAALYVDEHILLNQVDVKPEWKIAELERIREARGVAIRLKEIETQTQTNAPEDGGQVMQLQFRKERLAEQKMGEKEYQTFMRDLHARIRGTSIAILPLDIDGAAIDFSDYVRWVDSISRPDIAHAEYIEGWNARGDLLGQVASFMPFVIIILALTVGAGMFIAVLRLVH